MSIHPTSVIGDNVKLGKDVSIGPYCILQGDVEIGDGTRLLSSVVIGDERTKVRIGKNNEIHPGAVVGGPPQDLTYNGDPTELIMGNHNTIREFVTINTGTLKGGGVTRIGSHNLLMAYVHIAHDCVLSDHVVIANSCQLAGHVEIGQHVKVGGACYFNQFVVLGDYSYIAGDSSVNKDIVPFSIAQGKYALVRAANVIGMERAGYSKEEIEPVRKAIRILTKSKLTLEESILRINEECQTTDSLRCFMDFVTSEKRARGLAL